MYREDDTDSVQYIVDPSGAYPMVLMERDADTEEILRSYVQANGQTLCQYDGEIGGESVDQYFYLHDRLGSVRQIIDTDGDVANCYTYKPLGETIAAEVKDENVANPFLFTGQYRGTKQRYSLFADVEGAYGRQ